MRFNTVNSLNEKVRTIVYIPEKMVWSANKGQLKCMVVVYDRQTQYLLRQVKSEIMTIDSYFETYQDMLELWDYHMKTLHDKGV